MKAKRHEHISARTARHVAGLVNVALNKGVELPKWQPKDAHSLSPEEIQALRKACRGDWTIALLQSRGRSLVGDYRRKTTARYFATRTRTSSKTNFRS
jgi:hypothetical protein